MVHIKEGITDWNHLIDTVVKNTSLPVSREDCSSMMGQCCERVIEVYQDQRLAGYAIILNMFGIRTFHAYTFNFSAILAFRIAKRILNEYPDISITTTTDKYEVRRISHMLGFKNERIKGNVTWLKK